MAKATDAIPKNRHALTPQLVVHDGKAALEFYKKAFGAEERGPSMIGPGGKVMHAELLIGGSTLYVTDEFPEMGGTSRSPKTAGCDTGGIHLYCEDVDATFARAVQAGAKATMPPSDMFWGDRYARVIDPFGHGWGLATHKEDLTSEELEQRHAAFIQQLAQSQKK